MKRLKAFIVEDEKHNREYLTGLIHENFKNSIELVGSAPSSLESIEFLQKNKVDLLFLDIELSDGQVFDLLKRIDFKSYKLIFITGYSEHAIKAFKFSAIDYLLKPIVTDEFVEAVNKAISDSEHDYTVLENYINLNKFELDNYLIINNRQSIEKIPFEKIAYLEADGIYTLIYHDNKKTTSSKPLGVYEDVLPNKLFNRCHKSFIVNKHYIKKIEKGRGLDIHLLDGRQVPVSVRKKEEFSIWFKG
jgi:two-component system LytT family response regulator